MQPMKVPRDIYISLPENTDFNLENLRESGTYSDFKIFCDRAVLSANLGRSGALNARPFSLQFMSAVHELHAESASNWAKIITAKLLTESTLRDSPWRLHLFTIGKNSLPMISKYCSLIYGGVIKSLPDSALKNLTTDNSSPWLPDEKLVQLLLLDNAKGFLSIAPYRLKNTPLNSISRFPGGFVKIKDDKDPPSRAFKKILEVELRLGKKIKAGETVLDLGASPGGWSYIALKRGATVTAIDRSPLRDDLMLNKRLNFVRGDAFKYQSKSSFDWVLCDVAAFPERSIEILKTWVTTKRCKYFAVTLKFKGSRDFELVPTTEKLLSKVCRELFIQRLFYNKNEISVFGEVA